MMAFLWLVWSGAHALYDNYRYGDERLKTINTFLLAYFLARVVMFFFIVGGFSDDLTAFLGILGLGVGMNGGVARRPQPAPPVSAKAGNLADLLPQPKSAFSR